MKETGNEIESQIDRQEWPQSGHAEVGLMTKNAKLVVKSGLKAGGQKWL